MNESIKSAPFIDTPQAINRQPSKDEMIKAQADLLGEASDRLIERAKMIDSLQCRLRRAEAVAGFAIAICLILTLNHFI